MAPFLKAGMMKAEIKKREGNGGGMDILNEREGVRRTERERVTKILPSLKSLAIRAYISPMLEENQPSKRTDCPYCV